MKAALFETFGGPIEITEIPDPSPPPGGVVLEIGANGICRSDWHAWTGHDPTVALPHVPGHEMAGTVVAKAADVRRFEVGDRVTVPFVLGCGECRECASGNQQICDNQYQPGFSGWGAFAPFVALPYADGNLVRLPDALKFETAAGLGCRFATAYRAVVDKGGVIDGTTVAIWGCGGVGLSAVMIAAAMGATVVAIDIDQGALALARRFGAAHVVRSDKEPDAAATVSDLLDGGAEVSIDALGSVETAVSSVRSLRKRGKHVQVGLMIGDASHPVVPMWQLHSNEIEMHGVHGMQAWQYPEMLEMIGAGDVDPGALVTDTVDLRGGIRHLMSMEQFPGTGFVVINDLVDRAGSPHGSANA
ncbi:MAG: zinc-dependent alcohol dehydrogenase family protein [Actinomycetota bacterium]